MLLSGSTVVRFSVGAPGLERLATSTAPRRMTPTTTTVRWLDATDDLKAITVTAGAKDGQVTAALVLTLGLPAPGAKAP